MRHLAFNIYRCAENKFCYRLADRTGNLILHLECIETWMSCINIIVLLKVYVRSEEHYQLKDSMLNGSYSFEIHGASGHIIGFSKIYDNSFERDAAIEKVKYIAGEAGIEDLT